MCTKTLIGYWPMVQIQRVNDKKFTVHRMINFKSSFLFSISCDVIFEDEKWTPAYWKYSFCPVICSLWLLLLLLMMLFLFAPPTSLEIPENDRLQFIRFEFIATISCGFDLVSDWTKKNTHTMRVCVFSCYTTTICVVYTIHYPIEFSENDFGIITSLALNDAIVLHDIDTRFTAAAHHYSNSVNNIWLLHVQPKWHSRGVTIYPYSIFYG